jgi:hypothetical protein
MLPLQKDEIRLLVLDNHSSSAECSLIHVSLDTAPTFYALSYSWIDKSLFPSAEASPQNYIQIDGHPVAIGSNLSAALNAWRSHAFSHIPLWVDALCIDQSSIPERNKQVQRMYSIYSKAAVVAVWLGPDSHDSALALDFMSTFLQEARDPEWVRRTIREHTFSREWRAVDHLLRRSWWKRVWIIQEMVAATEVIFICGPRTVERDLVLRFFETLVALHDTYWTLLIHEEGIELYGDSITLGNTYLRAHSWDTHNLLQTIYTTGKSLASNSRDKIYAVLGLASDTRQLVRAPNYDLTVEEVYKQFVLSCVNEYQTLEFLSLAGLPVFPRRTDLSLPTWIPDLDHRNAATLNSTIRPAAPTTASRNYLARVEFSPDLEKMTALGICVDVIDGMSHSIWGARTNLADYKLQQPLSRIPKYTTALDALGALSRTLIANSPACEEGLSIFVQKCRESVPVAEQDRKSIPTSTSLFNEWYQHNRHFIISGKKLGEWAEDIGYSNMESNVSEAAKERYVNKLSIHGRNRRLVITEKGYLGLGVNSCMRGDLVCVLFGCSTPVFLRRVEEHYVFLGEAYLHGIMDGEAIGGLEKGELREEIFCIW